MQTSENTLPIIPRSKWWWLGLALLLLLASWLYLRGYNTSLPYIDHNDEPQNLLEAQHIIDMGHARGVFRESYPPGLRLVTLPVLKHIKPVDAHHGTMLPALRLMTISVWLLAIVMIALLGALMAQPLTGLMAAAIWIVNPWVVERAHWVVPDGYNTFLCLLALWLALVSHYQLRRSFNTAAVYSIMLAIAFKTQAIIIAPFILLLPLLTGWRIPPWRKDALRQTFWNGLRFAVFLYWLLLIYLTLDAPKHIFKFPITEVRFVMPTPDILWHGLSTLLVTVFHPLEIWLIALIGGALIWRYRRRINGVALIVVALSALAWLVGTHLLPSRGFSLRQYFGMGAMLATLFAVALTAIIYLLAELMRGLPSNSNKGSIARALPAGIVIVVLVVSLVPNYRESDALAHNFTLHDRRNDLMSYMDTSLPPGNYITDRDGPNHKVFNRSWGGYTGLHDYPLARTLRRLPERSLASWRSHDAVYAIMPYPPDADDPHIYFPDDTVLLKSYPPDPRFRGPSMVVLRLFPMQNESGAQLGPIQLVGYDLNTSEIAAGDDIVFRHYWRAQNPTSSIHHVFNHLISEAGEIAAQVDYVPLWDDRRPTTTWDDPDEILLGREFVLSLPPDLPPGVYRLISGLYDPATWQRLIAADGKDHIHIADIALTQPET